MYNNNNPSCRSGTFGTPGMKFHVQIVNDYHSLACYKESYSRGYGWPRSTCNSNSHKNTHLIGNLHVADSLEVSLTKFARAVFRNPIFDFWLEKHNEFTFFKVTGKTVPDSSANKRCCFNVISNRVDFSRF